MSKLIYPDCNRGFGHGPGSTNNSRKMLKARDIFVPSRKVMRKKSAQAHQDVAMKALLAFPYVTYNYVNDDAMRACLSRGLYKSWGDSYAKNRAWMMKIVTRIQNHNMKHLYEACQAVIEVDAFAGPGFFASLSNAQQKRVFCATYDQAPLFTLKVWRKSESKHVHFEE
jgi:hypothetical protein